ncbi:MAG TPA: hypothetical protein PLQ32_01080 [Flavihumibacter sp.]|nr:hypothetical protein [Bacteroidota bacterium]HOA38960.1 hypothetical protein [Flavihumibacter sp.]HPZ86664.1 hypothetical protein [Flavihumibacter sp.]HQD08397.1 hypothetical protein [Flavihumibacter sp.]
MTITVRHIAAAYLLLLTLLKLAAVPFACMEYALNKDYIAANLCENRNKPAMKCFGTCQLEKQLAKNADIPGTTNQKSFTTISIDYFDGIDSIDLPLFSKDIRLQYGFIEKLRFNQFTNLVFHPPLA